MAVLGSLISSLYSSDVGDSLTVLHPHAQSGAHDSVGAASTIAAHLPAHIGSNLLAAVGDAFTRAMGIGMLVSAAVAALTAMTVWRFLPSREAANTPTTADRAIQSLAPLPGTASER
ncbi:MAG: hypothetical protein ACXVHK_30395 [Solirubrobacteraceae bacterium]